jgi:hypothetical protein
MAPAALARLLFGETLGTPAAVTVASVAATALLALGVACWLATADAQSRSARGVVSAMVIYNLSAALVLGAAGIGSQLAGVGLWPAVLLHMAMAVWCLTSLFAKTQVSSAPGTPTPAERLVWDFVCTSLLH